MADRAAAAGWRENLNTQSPIFKSILLPIVVPEFVRDPLGQICKLERHENSRLASERVTGVLQEPILAKMIAAQRNDRDMCIFFAHSKRICST